MMVTMMMVSDDEREELYLRTVVGVCGVQRDFNALGVIGGTEEPHQSQSQQIFSS